MERQTVHLFVLDTLADWEPGYAISRINSPAWQAQPGRFEVKTVGLSRKPVTTMGGVSVLPDMSLAELEPARSAMLILPGADLWDQSEGTEAAEKAKAFLAAGVPVAAICGATFGLANAGLLNDLRHTSNALEYLRTSPNYRGEALYRHEPAVTDGNLITAGASAPIDFAYHILKRLDVFSAETLQAWYGLFKTGDPAHFYTLTAAHST